jgi:hypothetical protein
MAEMAYGLGPLVIVNTGLFLLLAASFFHPRTKRDTRVMGAFTAFLLACPGSVHRCDRFQRGPVSGPVPPGQLLLGRAYARCGGWASAASCCPRFNSDTSTGGPGSPGSLNEIRPRRSWSASGREHEELTMFSAETIGGSVRTFGLVAGVLAHRRELRRRDSWSREQLRDYQAHQLARLRTYTYARSPFYHRFHAGAFDRPLSELPVLTKAVLMEHFNELVTAGDIRLEHVEEYLSTLQGNKPFRGKYYASTTAGTTGRRSIFLWNIVEWVQVVAAPATPHEAPASPEAPVIIPTAPKSTEQVPAAGTLSAVSTISASHWLPPGFAPAPPATTAARWPSDVDDGQTGAAQSAPTTPPCATDCPEPTLTRTPTSWTPERP